MAKQKWCEVGEHFVPALWKAKSKVQQSCCKGCLHKAPVKADKAKEVVKQERNLFFAEQALVFPVNCENCGRALNPIDNKDRRAMTCHILPKKEGHGGFPSVALHPQNKVFMCWNRGCYGHGQYDNGDASTRIEMAVYQLAVERFRMFEQELTPNEHVRALKYLKLD